MTRSTIYAVGESENIILTIAHKCPGFLSVRLDQNQYSEKKELEQISLINQV